MLAKIDKDLKETLSIILDMWNIYFKYLDQANKPNEECDEISTHMLGLEQKLHISKDEKDQAVFLLQQQTVKVKLYK